MYTRTVYLLLAESIRDLKFYIVLDYTSREMTRQVLYNRSSLVTKIMHRITFTNVRTFMITSKWNHLR